MKIICFYWQGDRWKSDLTGEMPEDNSYNAILRKTGEVSLDLASQYVNKLFRGITRNTSINFDFICFTNEKLSLDQGIEVREFPMLTDRGVLPRIYMFSPDAGLSGQVLCLDLDVIICGNMDRLMAYNGLFCARSKFKPGEKWKLDGDVMSFRAGKETEKLFWEPFIRNVNAAVELTQGRERYWIRHVAGDIADRWDKVVPGAIISYKWHARRDRKHLRRASIISCHGYPRPHQVEEKYIKKYWR